MRHTQALVTFAVLLSAYGCMSAASPKKAQSAPAEDQMHGIAGWYGQEFAGRTTANGEIFDPMLLTAAHRTLPFGTIVDVKNPKTGQLVRVRINDRGPFVGNRVIDLSYAAAQQVGLVDMPGTVDLTVAHLGLGDREPPAPFVVNIPAPASAQTPASDVPDVDIPLPDSQKKIVVETLPESQPAVAAAPPVTAEKDFHIQVVEEHAGTTVETRRQVGADGRTITRVPVEPGTSASSPEPSTSAAPPPVKVVPPAQVRPAKFVIQVGAFAQEVNAKRLQEHLTDIHQTSYIDRNASLYRVRMGPFMTREEALRARATLESAGISAVVVPESSR